MSVPRYTDPYLNALMDSHGMTLRCELWLSGTNVGRLSVQSGSVSCDRGSSVRRTATLSLDPGNVTDPVLGPKLNPYGSLIKIWRGIRYPNGVVAEAQIFTGRIDAITVNIKDVSVRCSDMAAMVVDSRFGKRYQVTNATTKVIDLVRTLITDAVPGATFYQDIVPAPTLVVRNGTVWEQERSEALDQLATQVGGEWFADTAGDFHLRTLPATITASTVPAWIIDTGDSGVLVSNVVTSDRQNVFNEVWVEGTPIGGTQSAVGHWQDTNAASPTYFGGPYGKIPTWYTGQQLDPNDTIAADTLAAKLGQQSVSATSSLSVSCVVNAKLNLGDPVTVYAPRFGVNGTYYIQSMDIPLTMSDTMTLTLNRAIVVAGTSWEWAPPRIPEGSTWQPGM